MTSALEGRPRDDGPTDPALTRRVAVVIRARLLTTVLDTATGLILVRLLAKEDFAVLGLLLLVYETTKTVGTLGFPDSVLYFFESWGETKRRAFALRTIALVTLSAVLAGALMLGMAATAEWWLSGWAPEQAAAVGRYLPFMALLALLEFPTWPVTNVLVGLDKARQAGWFQIGTSVLMLGALVGPLLLGLGLEGAMFGLLAYGAVRLVGSALWLARALPRDGQVLLHPQALREQIRFAVPLGFGALTTRLNKYADKLVVAVMLTEAAYADYQVAAYELPFVTAFPYGAASVLIGRYVGLWQAGDREGLARLWHRSVRTVGLLPIAAAAIAIASAPDLIPFAFGPQYGGAVAPFQVFCAILMVRVANYGALIQAMGRPDMVLRLTGASLVLNLVLNVPFTWLMGTVGTALATLVTRVLTIGGVMFPFLARRLGIPAWQVVPPGPYLRTVALAAGSAGAGLVLRRLLLDAGRHDLVTVLAVVLPALVFYLAVGTATGVIRRRDWAAFAAVAGRDRG